MALLVACPNGHTYIHADVYKDWPEDAPYCPACFEEWAKERGLAVVDYYGVDKADDLIIKPFLTSPE
jgi:hypothetical protein